ncbi:MAG: hypothetical protein IJ087_00540 [Eggerthellaceae bacterium]|nr:hypothetical protein [Eggerthellaceae bacterium]
MIDGTYDIKITNLAGRPTGTVELRSDGGKVFAEIAAPVIGRQHVKGRLEDEDSFSAQGSFWLLLFGKIRYKLRCKVDGDSLRIAIRSTRGNFNFTGHRVD